jgi:septal ring factor EnvC (AmiA/AmiB activator)
MRFPNGAVAAAALVLVAALAAVAVGCAKPRPCTIIPMQLDLVRYDAKQVEKQVTAKEGEVSSLQANVDMARTRLTQLEQEEAELNKAIAAARADSAAKGRKK